jgi:hypothetical protein
VSEGGVKRREVFELWEPREEVDHPAEVFERLERRGALWEPLLLLGAVHTVASVNDPSTKGLWDSGETP